MRKIFTLTFLILTINSYSQTPGTAGEYMDYLSEREQELQKKYLTYMSEVAHGNRARKMEKRRQDLIAQIKESLSDANRLRPFKGDASLRDAFKNYWDILLKVFNEDYHKIVNMEEIAEQSYDNMEAYLLAQEKAGDVLEKAHGIIPPVYRAFAANNNIRLVTGGESKLQEKLHQVGLVNAYYHKIFLSFFKSYKQEGYVWETFNKKDLNGVEQNRSRLVKVCDEELAKLDTMTAFKGDNSLLAASQNVVRYLKTEAENQLPGLSDYILKSDEFTRIKKAFDSKPVSKRTQADIDVYNKAVNDLNSAIASSNKVVNDTNVSRKKVMDNWENARKKFMETHVPKD
jgi:hypothetical protein